MRGLFKYVYCTLVLKVFSLVPGGGDSNIKGTGMRVGGIKSLKDIKGTNLGVASPYAVQNTQSKCFRSSAKTTAVRF